MGLNLSELTYINEAITSSGVTDTNEKVAPRRTIVYQTLIDPAVVRIEGEKNKHKLFNKYLFNLNNPAEIEFVSIEKYYEPYITVSGKYSIDYYRKVTYPVRVDKEVTEVILFSQTFRPNQTSNSIGIEHAIKLEGEERLIREPKTFLLLNKKGQELKLSECPSAPSEENPQELIASLKMSEVDPKMDVEAVRKKIGQRPKDVNRIVNEVLEIDERSLIYAPRFKLTYRCPRIAKEAYFEFDGVTSKMIRQNENVISATIRAITTKITHLFSMS